MFLLYLSICSIIKVYQFVFIVLINVLTCSHVFNCTYLIVSTDSMSCISHNSRGRLSDLVAEHLDHLHYLNDILCLDIDALNEVLTDHLLNRLFIPLYVYSLIEPTGLQDRMVCS